MSALPAVNVIWKPPLAESLICMQVKINLLVNTKIDNTSASCHHSFSSFTMTLKIIKKCKARSPKPNQVFIMPQHYIHPICPLWFMRNPAHKCIMPTLILKLHYDLENNGARSPKLNHVFIMPYYYANLVPICPPVRHEISSMTG